MAAERPGRRELAQPVAHHPLGHVDRREPAASVHRDREPHELRRDDAAAGIALDRTRLACIRHLLEPAVELLVNVRALPDGTSHYFFLLWRIMRLDFFFRFLDLGLFGQFGFFDGHGVKFNTFFLNLLHRFLGLRLRYIRRIGLV